MEDLQTRQIPGFPKYRVSACGRVFIELIKGHKELMPRNSHGYLSVRMREGGEVWKWRKIHRLVAFAWMEAPEGEKLEVCHINGDRTDNRLENLKWDTRKNNIADRKRYNPEFTKSGKRKLTPEMVEQIREELERGESGNSISDKWGISPFHVSNIKNGRTWRKNNESMQSQD